MKVLLVRPVSKTHVIVPPIGLGYLATSLKKAGHSVSILDCVKEKMTYEDFEKYIKENKPSVVGITVFSYDLNSAKKSINLIKKIDQKIVTVVGGPHPSGDPIQTMEFLDNVDFAFKGEAEVGLPMLLDEIQNNGDFEKVPGLVWKRKKIIIINQQKFVEDLGSLGFPRWELLKPHEYPEAPHGGFAKKFPVAPIIITRGCPFQCTFCAGHEITGKKIRSRPIKDVIKEIELLYNQYGIREIHIEDDNFTLNKNLVREFTTLLIKKRLKISWCCPNGVRLDTLDEDLLKLMKKSGCYSLSVGIESGSDKILKHMKKNLTVDKIKEKIKLINKVGISVIGFFILGYPTETKDDIISTIEFAKSLPLSRAEFNIFLPLPGSEMYEKLKEECKLNNINWNNFFVTKVAYSENITKEELKKFQKEAFLKFYLRPKIILGMLKNVKSLKQFKYLISRISDYLR